jgi:hypothetical protein
LKVEPNNVVWQIRHAGLLAESGRTDRAKDALREIELLNPRAEQLSEEAWSRLQLLRSRLTQASL